MGTSNETITLLLAENNAFKIKFDQTFEDLKQLKKEKYETDAAFNLEIQLKDKLIQTMQTKLVAATMELTQIKTGENSVETNLEYDISLKLLNDLRKSIDENFNWQKN